jgi:hypothetical protein
MNGFKKRCMDEIWKDSSYYNNGAHKVLMEHIAIGIRPGLIKNPAPTLPRGDELPICNI